MVIYVNIFALTHAGNLSNMMPVVYLSCVVVYYSHTQLSHHIELAEVRNPSIVTLVKQFFFHVPALQIFAVLFKTVVNSNNVPQIYLNVL